ncbi:MAG: TAXI family TRAP transporter solute-binding subunit [Pseudomonadota bacterium]
MDRPCTRHVLSRRRTLGLLAAGALGPGIVRADETQEVRSFTIATGGLGGTYYPVGGQLADLLTAPPGGLACRPGERCGVRNMVAVAQTSEGSVANVRSLARGTVDSAFCQADVAHQALHGDGPFADEPIPRLRVIASLYPEVAQLVLADGGKAEPRRLGVGAGGSGTRVVAERLLDGFGLSEAVREPVELNPGPSIDAMEADELDGFLTIAGLPTAAVDEALGRLSAQLVPIERAAADAFLRERSFWRIRTIPAGLYPGQDAAIRTLAVAALWIVDAEMDETLVAELLTALWAPESALVLMGGHPAAAMIHLSTALHGLSVPLHPGAARFYRELGILDETGLGLHVPSRRPIPSSTADG